MSQNTMSASLLLISHLIMCKLIRHVQHGYISRLTRTLTIADHHI
jgi:hypothetical protein